MQPYQTSPEISGLSFLILIGLYVYYAFAWMSIAKKLSYDKPWLAWIPVANIFLIPILANKHWAWGFMFFVPIAGLVFGFIWVWNIYKQRNYPGVLSLVPLASIFPPLAGLAVLANMVVTGLVAWKDRVKKGS